MREQKCDGANPMKLNEIFSISLRYTYENSKQQQQGAKIRRCNIEMSVSCELHTNAIIDLKQNTILFI